MTGGDDMPTRTAEKQGIINQAQHERRSALDMLDLSLVKGDITRDEAAKWIDLIFRCRSLADITKLRAMIAGMTGLNL